MIHTAFFSCAESNAYIMIIYKSSHPSENLLRMLVSFTKKRKWRQKTERAVNSAKDGPNIAAFAGK